MNQTYQKNEADNKLPPVAKGTSYQQGYTLTLNIAIKDFVLFWKAQETHNLPGGLDRLVLTTTDPLNAEVGGVALGKISNFRLTFPTIFRPTRERGRVKCKIGAKTLTIALDGLTQEGWDEWSSWIKGRNAFLKKFKNQEITPKNAQSQPTAGPFPLSSLNPPTGGEK